MSTENDNKCKEDKAVYLQILQEPISRTSSTAAVFKGFSSTVLAGLASASFTEISPMALSLGLLPIISFFCLDVYYLSLERALRYRYRMVAEDKATIDFSINTKLTNQEKREAKSKFLLCLLSPSIWLFYVPVLGCTFALMLLKWRGDL